VSLERRVRTFKNGRNQAVRIPHESNCRARMRSYERKATGSSSNPLPKSLLAVLATLVQLEEDFPCITDLPPDPVDL
jgi:antitoxin VapB